MTWPLSDSGYSEHSADTATSSGFATITASATTHTKGSWTQLIASTGVDYTELTVIMLQSISTAATNTSMLLDIGVGGAGSEVVLLANIGLGHAAQGRQLEFPIKLPAATRISARIQSAVVSATAEIGVSMAGGGGWAPFDAGQRATTYGANTGTSSGVTLTLPGATHTKGAWVAIDAATANPIRWLVPCIVGHPTDTAWAAAHRGLVDVGWGAAASEQVVVPNIPYSASQNEGMSHYPNCFPVNIPAGARLAARYQAAQTSEAPALVVIGID